MKIYTSAIIGLCLAAAITSQAVSTERQQASPGAGVSLAVLNIDSPSRVNKDAADLLTDSIRRELAKTGPYSIMEQKRMEELVPGISTKMTGCASKDCAVEAGRALGAAYVVVGSLAKTGKSYYLSLSRVNVHTRIVEFSVEDKCPAEKGELPQLSKHAVSQLMGIVDASLHPATGREDERFAFHSLIALDKESKIIWVRDAGATGKPMTWDEANEYIERLNRQRYADYSDWRLPGKDELATLIEFAKARGKKRSLNELFIKLGFKNVRAEYYWSDTSSADMTGLAWVLDVYAGEMSTADKNTPCFVWPVRSGSWLQGEKAEPRQDLLQ